jgi:hypothetical protein
MRQSVPLRNSDPEDLVALANEMRVAACWSPGAELLRDAALLFRAAASTAKNQGAERSEGHVRPW